MLTRRHAQSCDKNSTVEQAQEDSVLQKRTPTTKRFVSWRSRESGPIRAMNPGILLFRRRFCQIVWSYEVCLDSFLFSLSFKCAVLLSCATDLLRIAQVSFHGPSKRLSPPVLPLIPSLALVIPPASYTLMPKVPLTSSVHLRIGRPLGRLLRIKLSIPSLLLLPLCVA